MSNIPSQQQWFDHHHQLYQSIPLQDQEQSISSDRFSSTFTNSTAVTNATTIAADDSVAHLNPEGRVAKPNRRRSRVSKKTHNVTMVNTDIANFRSMVQQFTGGTIPEVVFPFAPQVSNATTANLNASQYPMNPSTSGYQQFQNQQQQLQQQQQQQQYRYSMYR